MYLMSFKVMQKKVDLKTSEKMNEKNKGVVVSRKDTNVHPIVNEKCKYQNEK